MSRCILAVIAMAGAAMAASVLAASAPPPRTPELVEKGKVSFERNCAVCHGEKGAGDGVAAESLDPKPRNLAGARLGAKAIFKVLATGKEGTAMIAFTHLPEEERWAIAYFVDEIGAKPASKK